MRVAVRPPGAPRRAPAVLVALLAGLGVWACHAFFVGTARGQALDEAFRYAMAAGAAALLSPGTKLCDPADVERMYREVVVTAA